MLVYAFVLGRFTILGIGCSQLGVGESDLASASFLFQGLPDSVLGLHFGYDSDTKVDLETFLALKLKDRSEANAAPRRGLEMLISGLYHDKSVKPRLVLTKSQALQGILDLDADRRPHTRIESLLRESLRYYFELRAMPDTAPRTLERLRGMFGSTSRIVHHNLVDVTKSLRFESQPGTEWSRFGVYR